MSTLELKIPYQPSPKQQEIHDSTARFKVVAAGRRFGKTTLAINELIKKAISYPQQPGRPVPRSWFVCATYKQAEMIAWKMLFQYLPKEVIKKKNLMKLQVELTNGHLIEFRGSQDYDKLRGAALAFVVLDEFGFMAPEVWDEILRPSLADFRGTALFIGTPGHDGSPHFQELFQRGLQDAENYKSWLCFTTDNPNKQIQDDAARAKQELSPDIYKREYEADFSITAGLIYDNFRHALHVIPNYEPTSFDFVVGSIDPGLHNPTGAVLCAWDREGKGRIFKEYYQEQKLASENAIALYKLSKPYKVAYWIIDRASTHRDPATGVTVFGKYQEVLGRLLTSPNDPGSVWAGIDQVKTLLHQRKLLVSALCSTTLWEFGRYTRYKRKWHVDKNEEEKPRKLDDHIMDAIRNMVMTKPWVRPSLRMHIPQRTGYGF